jgi:hypothetical protein
MQKEIIPQFYSKTKAKQMVAYRLKCAKKQGCAILKIDIEDAYKLFVTNKLFKKNPFGIKGISQPGDFLVIIYYNTDPQAKMVKKKRKSAPKVKTGEPKLKKIKRNPKEQVKPEEKYKKTLIVPFPVSIFALTYNHRHRLAA